MSEGNSGSVHRVAAVLPAVAALGTCARVVAAAGRHPAAVLPGLVHLLGLVLLVWTRTGEGMTGRIGLGILLVVSAIAMTGLLFVQGGRTLGALALGLLFLPGAAALLVPAPVRPEPGAGPSSVLVAVSGALVYFLAISGRGAAPVVLAALFLLALVAALVSGARVHPAERAGGSPAVR